MPQADLPTLRSDATRDAALQSLITEYWTNDEEITDLLAGMTDQITVDLVAAVLAEFEPVLNQDEEDQALLKRLKTLAIQASEQGNLAFAGIMLSQEQQVELSASLPNGDVISGEAALLQTQALFILESTLFEVACAICCQIEGEDAVNDWADEMDSVHMAWAQVFTISQQIEDPKLVEELAKAEDLRESIRARVLGGLH